MTDDEVLAALASLDPATVDRLRSLMRTDQQERDDFANALLRVGSEAGDLLADLIDMSSIAAELRRQMVRVFF